MTVDQIQEYLTFSLGQELYGVDILKVQEIRGWESPRELHDVPAYIKGVFDFRGSIIPVVDLRIRFGFQHYEYKPTTVVIVIATEHDTMMAIVVDAVSDVLSVKQSDIKSSPSMGSRIKTDYVMGMVSRETDMIMLVDSDRLVNPEDLELDE